MANSNTPKQPEKISADCPHCGFSQLESAYAKSTFCRKCGEHFSIEKLLLKEASSLRGPSFFDKFSKLLSREKVRDVTCFGCGAKQQLSSEIQSTSCPQCGSYIDLREFRIAGPFGRSIQTQGEVIITSKADVASSRIACGSALVEGKFKGFLLCTGLARLKLHGKFLGSIKAEKLLVEKKSEIEFVRPIKGGFLQGTVHAKAITIEKGGVFSGELFIGEEEGTAEIPDPTEPVQRSAHEEF